MATKFLDHELTQFCWCRPRVEVIEEGHIGIYHRRGFLTMDFQPRARSAVLEGPPA